MHGRPHLTAPDLFGPAPRGESRDRADGLLDGLFLEDGLEVPLEPGELGGKLARGRGASRGYPLRRLVTEMAQEEPEQVPGLPSGNRLCRGCQRCIGGLDPARSTMRANSRPTGCTARRFSLARAVPSRTGIASSTRRGSPAPAGGAIRPNDRRDARERMASSSWERKGLPSTAISASGSRSSASTENARRKDSRSLKNGRSAWGKRSSE